MSLLFAETRSLISLIFELCYNISRPFKVFLSPTCISNWTMIFKNGFDMIAFSPKHLKKSYSIIIAIYFLSTIVADQIA